MKRLLLGIVPVAAATFGGGGYYYFSQYTDLLADPPVQEQASTDEVSAQKAIAQSFPGSLLFDSNRSGSFGVYTIKADGTDLQAVVDGPKHEVYPAPSPDGTAIAYAVTDSLERGAPAEIWIANRNGTNARLLASNGTFPSFSQDGTKVYYQHKRNALFVVNASGGEPQRLFPKPQHKWGKFQIVSPRVSPDGTKVAFTSDKGGRWHAWYADIESGAASKMANGCEPGWFPNASRMMMVHKSTAKERSGIFEFSPATQALTVLQDLGPPRGHEYFPTITKDGNFLLYSACREREHSHETANYQLFIRELSSNRVARVTFDTFTNRWPQLLPAETD